jgi:hypothetical protein
MHGLMMDAPLLTTGILRYAAVAHRAGSPRGEGDRVGATELSEHLNDRTRRVGR